VFRPLAFTNGTWFRASLRIWTSDPPRSKCTSSIYAFINWMPRPVFGVVVRCDAVTHYRFEVESFSLIRHHDGYFIAGLAAAGGRVLFLSGFFLIAVHECIFQRFPESQLDLELFFLERIEPLQSTSSSGPPVVRSLESCWVSKSRLQGWKNGNVFLGTAIGNLVFCSDFACHSWPNASHSGENASQGPKRGGLLRLRNLLICIGMASRRTVLQTKLPACQCQRDGRLPVSRHRKEER